jgi:hypothetical protein
MNHVNRIKNEFKNEKNKRPSSKCDIISIKYSKQDANIHFTYKNQSVFVYVESYYPFQPPRSVIINNILYNGKLKSSYEAKEYFKNNKNIECMCCDTCLCSDKWTPTKYLFDIVDEYLERKHVIDEIRNLNIIKYNTEIPIEIINLIQTFVL